MASGDASRVRLAILLPVRVVRLSKLVHFYILSKGNMRTNVFNSQQQSIYEYFSLHKFFGMIA